jgi:flagellar protein FliT
MKSMDIITLYEAMSANTGEMLTAARAEDWESLAVLEASRSAYEQALKGQEQQQVLSSPQREHVINIIQKILEDDLEILGLTKARMAQLSSLMNSAKTERKLSDTYA